MSSNRGNFWDEDAMPGYLKAALLGRQGTGKTMTAVLLLLAYRHMRGLKGPLAFFDTETGSAYVRPMIEKFTGQRLLTKRARAIEDVVRFIRAAQEAGAAGAVIDSVTHLWRSLCDGYLAAVNERRKQQGYGPLYRLEFQHWNAIKPRWQTFADLYLNEPIAIVACGRAGWEYEMADSDEKDSNGKPKKELQKVGVKMKAEGEFGYESSLLVEMDSEQNLGGEHTVISRRATILKDRFSVIDGATHLFPSVKPAEFDRALREVGDFFKPHLALLVNGGHVAVDTSPGKVDDEQIQNGGIRGDVAPLVARPSGTAQPVTAAPAPEHEPEHANSTALAVWEEFFATAPFEEFNASTLAALMKDFGGAPPREVQIKWYAALGARYVQVAAEATTPEGVAQLRQQAEKDWQGKPLPAKMAAAFEAAAARVAPRQQAPAAPAPSGDGFGPPPDEDDGEEVVDDGHGPVADTSGTWLARIGTATTMDALDQLEQAALAELPERYHGMIRASARYNRDRLNGRPAGATGAPPPPPAGPPPASVTPITVRRTAGPRRAS